MADFRFVLNQPVPVEETRHYEFKEIKGNNPVDTIRNVVDEYAVAFLNSEGGRILWGVRDSDRAIVGVHLNGRQRDELRRAITSKLTSIQPSVAPTAYRIVLHEVYEENASEQSITDLYVVEVIVPRVYNSDNLYFTASNESFVKVDGVKKKLSPLELQDEIRRRLTDHSVNSERLLSHPVALCVSNLPYSINEQTLREIFGEYGNVLSARVLREENARRSMGFGIVEIENAQEAQAAITALDGGEIEGRKIHITIAENLTRAFEIIELESARYKIRMANKRN